MIDSTDRRRRFFAKAALQRAPRALRLLLRMSVEKNMMAGGRVGAVSRPNDSKKVRVTHLKFLEWPTPP